MGAELDFRYRPRNQGGLAGRSPLTVRLSSVFGSACEGFSEF